LTDYTKATNFTSKDSLSTGNPLKIVKGTEIDTEFNNIQTAVATKTDNANAAITGGSITGITDLAVADGGTGASTAANARTNLSAAASGANSDITSITGLTTALTASQGGTGITSSGTNGNLLTSNGTTWVSSAPSGVTSSVAGNGISVSASTGAVTFSLGAPSQGSIGSYVIGGSTSYGVFGSGVATIGSSYSSMYACKQSTSGADSALSLSGTWLCVSTINLLFKVGCNLYAAGLFVRIS